MCLKSIRSSADAYLGLFPLLLLYTGLRRGEALALTWGDIDFANKIISVTKAVEFIGGMPQLKEPKTKAGFRTVPLLDDLAAHLHPKGRVRPEEYLFPSTSGGLMLQAAYKHHWTHYCKDVGFVTTESEERVSKQGKKYIHTSYTPTLTAHQLRHAYATILYEAGIDEFTAKALLGHADIETTHMWLFVF